jgi:hypothetical protein
MNIRVGCEIFTIYSTNVPTYTVIFKNKVKILHTTASRVIVGAGCLKDKSHKIFFKTLF